MIGKVPWGTHFCQFYQTKKDLLDILIPYFKSGLKNNEYCMWVTSKPLNVEEAVKRMKTTMPDFESYLNKGQIKIIPYTKWYLKDGSFDDKRVLEGWVNKLNQALRKGYDGLRLTGNTLWLEQKGWKKFTEYEEEVNGVIRNYKMIAVCTYSLDRCGASEIVDVVNNHQFAMIKKSGHWTLFQNSVRKKMEEALQLSQTRFKSNIELTRQIPWTTNANGKVTEDLPVWRKFTGQTYEEIKGSDWSKALHPDDFDRTLKIWKDSVKNRSNYETEYRIRRHNGVYRNFLVRGTPLFNEGGKIREWVGTCIDVTERKTAEEALRESEYRLKRAQEISHLGSWELDLLNNKLTWSDEVYRIFGLKPQQFDATYEAFLEAVHPEDRTTVDTAYSGSLRKKSDGYEIEHRIVRKSDNQTRYVYEKCEHIRDGSGKIIKSIGMVHDITERKEEEKRIEHLLGIAHHELKTPLTSLKGFSQLLKKRLAKEGDEKKLFFVSKIESQTDRLVELIDQLLNVTRIKAGKMEFMDDYFDLNKLVNEVIENLKPTTSHKIIKQGRKPKIIFADPKYISRIITNMITNAIKYSLGRNKIIVKVAGEIESVTVSVQDFGRGIKKGKQWVIFEPYSRIETRKEEKVPGLGLGLYIAREIASHYKGKIWVNSKTGQGSTFYFQMPC